MFIQFDLNRILNKRGRWFGAGEAGEAGGAGGAGIGKMGEIGGMGEIGWMGELILLQKKNLRVSGDLRISYVPL